MTEQDRLIRIENKLDKLIESNGQQNERIAVPASVNLAALDVLVTSRFIVK